MTVSKAIVGSPNLLFLGAGASKHYDKLLMGEFIRSFRDELAGRSEHSPPAISTSHSHLLNAICKKQEDLEFLIEELEALSSRSYLGMYSYNPNPAGLGLGSGTGAQKVAWPDFQILSTEASNLLKKLKREVYLAYRSIPDRTKTSVLAEPIDLLQNGSHPMMVFTTNYDPAVEVFCDIHDFSLFDGFARRRGRQDVWDRQNFDGFGLPEPGTAKATERSLVLFKLHGSANWVKSEGKILLSPPMYTTDPDFQNVMIYPATRKVAIEEPFFTSYDYLEQCLDEAQSCLVIGYSFRDYDTLMRFKSAKLSNEGLKILVLDPAAIEICKTLERQHGVLAYPIPHAFGRDEEEYLPLIRSGLGLD